MRSHNFADIMVRLEVDEFTQNDSDRVKELESERDTLVNKNGRAVKWTETKQAEIDKLIYKKDAKPELSKGAKTAIQTTFLEKELGIEKIKQMTLEIEKGLICEEDAIKTVSRRIGRPLVKNMIEKTDDFGTGVIDTRFGNKCIFDIKCSYSLETFPMFEEDNGKFLSSKYLWQMKRYLMLWNIPHGYVAYVLENHPEEIMYRASKKLWKDECIRKGIVKDMPDWFVDVAREKYNYDKLSDEQRTRFFEVKVTDEDIQKVKKHYELANEYYQSLFEKNKMLNSLKIEI